MAMYYEEPIFGRNESSHLGVDDLDMNTFTVLNSRWSLSPSNRVRKDAVCVNAPGSFTTGRGTWMVGIF